MDNIKQIVLPTDRLGGPQHQVPLLSQRKVEQRNQPASQIEAPSAMESAMLSRLTLSGYPILKRIACRCCDGTVQMTERLPSFYLKQVAQEAVRRVDGVHTIQNRIEVVTVWEETNSKA